MCHIPTILLPQIVGIVILMNINILSCIFLSSRDTSPQRTSTMCLGWPWISLTAWPCGRRTTWKRRHAFSKAKQKNGRKRIITSPVYNVCPVWKKGRQKKKKNIWNNLHMHRYVTTEKHLISTRMRSGGGTQWKWFHNVAVTDIQRWGDVRHL